MSINKNIMKKIMDKMALNKWKNKVKDINGEYYHYFKWAGYLSLNNHNYRCAGSYPLYGHRIYLIGSTIWNCNIRICSQCGKYHPSVIGNAVVNKLPKKYSYTSGMNDPNGYKKIE